MQIGVVVLPLDPLGSADSPALDESATDPGAPAPDPTWTRPESAPGRTHEPVRWEAERPLIPASLAKIPTFALAFEQLGPGYTFRTNVLAAGEITRDTLRGDLVLRGGGDPFLVSERLWLLARQIRQTGLAHVEGDLILDRGWLAPDSLDPARARDREISDRPYAARLSALPVNFNAAGIRLVPGARAGQAAQASLEAEAPGHLRLETTLRTTPPGSATEWTVTLEPSAVGELVRVAGAIAAGSGPALEYRSVRDPDLHALAVLRGFLAGAGTTVAGIDRIGAPSREPQPLIEFASPPLRELAASAQRFSNNLMADQVAMALALGEDGTGQASLTAGAEQITAYLRRTSGAGPEVRQFDGSGLHPASRVTAAAMAAVLARAWGRFESAPEFVAALAVPGEDGTLRRRFDGAGRSLRGKTGTMSNPPVSGLAGYLDAAGQPVAFVILMNGTLGAPWDHARARELQEAWIREYLR